jgi:transcriptional regulator with XRE-family HTH domain
MANYFMIAVSAVSAFFSIIRQAGTAQHFEEDNIMVSEKINAPAETAEKAFMGNLYRLGDHIAHLRKQSGMTQETVAERLDSSVSAISRIERGERMTTLSNYRAMFELFGMPLDDALTILLDGGHYGDDTYNRLRIAIRDEDPGKMREVLDQVDEGKLAGSGMLRQLYQYAGILLGPALDVHSTVARLVEILRITNTDFDLGRIAEYRLRFDELMIINEIGRHYMYAGEFEKAAKVFQDAMASLDRFCLNERLKCEVYSGLLYNLSSCYGGLGRHKEAEQVCQKARKLDARFGSFGTLPYLLNNIGEARRQLGDLPGALEMAVQAYYTALAMGKTEDAGQIKIDAKDELGIDLNIIEPLLLESAGHKRQAQKPETLRTS